jgi:riboflavin synthase
LFTGLVEERGSVVRIDELSDSVRMTVSGPLVTSDARHGDSIAVNGVCLTVVGQEADSFTADVMRETLTRSSLGTLAAGDCSEP